MILRRVISGGQTGADRAGLIAAKACGILTGGWMPKGYIALDGIHPKFAQMYDILEHKSDKYGQRTKLNIVESEGTVRFASQWNAAAEKLTLKEILKSDRPYLDIETGAEAKLTPQDLVKWLKEKKIRVLNVSGNAEENSMGIEAKVVDFLTETFKLLQAE